MAEGEGFEPPDPFESTVFKTAAFNHSANLPQKFVKLYHIADANAINACRIPSSVRIDESPARSFAAPGNPLK